MMTRASAVVLFLTLSVRAQDIPNPVAVSTPPVDTYAVTRDYARWEKDIAAFEAKDREAPPAKDGALFIGSSTVRMWTSLEEDYPGFKVINRGFGGSEIVDSTHFADRIIFPYEPKQIFLRAGNNDIANGRTPKQVAADFAEFVRVVHEKLPKAEILYIGLCPAPVRWGQADKTRELNRLIRTMALDMPRVGYIECFDMSLNADGSVRPELFIKDRLHLNADGYRLLAERVRPYLVP
jgi:hypothetical protein